MSIKLTQQDIIFAIVATTALSIGYLASDICLPALPLLVQQFHITPAQASHIISIYCFGLGTAFLISGPIIDHVSFRKVALIACLSLCLTSLWCALTYSQPMLLMARFFQAISAGFLATTARASFVKFYRPKVAALMFIRATPASSFAPALAPFIGGYLTYHFTWHATFLFIVFASIALFVGIIRIFYIPHDDQHKKIPTIASLSHTYKTILSNRTFLGYLVLITSAFAIYIAYITDAPFIFHQHQWTTVAIGYSFTPVALTFFISSQTIKELRYQLIIQLDILLHFSVSFAQ